MTTAFVLSGGGSLGAVQVGMLAALEARGFRPDLLVGTSVGALNAAYLGANGCDAEAVDGLAAIWRKLRHADVFPIDPLRQTLAAAGRRPSLCSRRPLRRLVEANLPITELEEARIPLHIVATDVMSGVEVLLSSGDAISAVLASAAIPRCSLRSNATVWCSWTAAWPITPVCRMRSRSVLIALSCSRPDSRAPCSRLPRHPSRPRCMHSRSSSSSA